jgi:hypothetical protein
MMVVKQPGVDIALAQSCLNGGKIHGQTTILTMTEVLSESSVARAVAQFDCHPEQAFLAP